MKVYAAEVLSPPLVILEAQKVRLKPGEAFDLTKAGDFTWQDHREQVDQWVNEYEPLVIMGAHRAVPLDL